MATATVGTTLDRGLFLEPPGEFRSVPFFSWNDALEDDELRRQIRSLHEAGQGGFFIHARVGLRTPYLSEAWFHSVRTCLEAADELGMDAWLYDEDRWPSGFAGGIVPAMEEAYRSQALICLVARTPIAVKEALVRVTGRFEAGELVDVRPWSPEDGYPEDGHVVVQCYPWIAPMGQGWFGGATFLNTLNPEAVKTFLDVTYERYAAETSDSFGKVIPGIFTDEPSIWYRGSLPAVHGIGQPPAVPWTSEFPEYFEARHGYDIRPHLHALFFQVDGYEAVRHDFWEAATARFSEAWSEQLYAWCEAHGLPLTGHHMAEDGLGYQMQWTGGVMPHYRYYHVPGIDKLERNTRQVVTVKQLDSVVEQLGKPRALCEAFGCSGQDFAIEGRWWITNWLCVLGINLFNPHLALYSLRGERKRDYPPVLSYQQPWWEYQKPYEDATSRLCYALSQGRRQVDLLVIHPMSSAWVSYSPLAHNDVDALDRGFERLSRGLLGLHRDYHYGDETILAETGSIEGDRLRVGEQSYRVAIVPPVPSLRRSTADLLARFAAAGGTVIVIGERPALLDGRPVHSGDVLPAAQIVPDEVEGATPETWYDDLPALRAALDAAAPTICTIAGPGTETIWYQARDLGDGRELLFLANTSETQDASCTVEWSGTGAIERWDYVEGSTRAQPARTTSTGTSFTLDLPRMGGALFVRTPGNAAEQAEAPAIQTVSLAIGQEWRVERLSPNALVLDSCEYRVGDGAWQPAGHILQVADTIRTAGLGTPFTLRFRFWADGASPADAAIVVEELKELTLALNGTPLTARDGWWVDRTFHRYPLADRIETGENLIEIAGAFGEDTELEAIYLTGSFLVPAALEDGPVERTGQRFNGWRVEPRIVPEAAGETYTANEDLVGRGFPHFTGELRLTQKVGLDDVPAGTRVRLEFDRLDAATAFVEVNGVEVGQTLWPPYAVDVTDVIRPGENEISVRLVTSLRNLLGPLHVAGGDAVGIGPLTFRDTRQWTDNSWLVPLGVGAVALTAHLP